MVECQYSVMGCKWEGAAREQALHEGRCKVKGKTGEQLVKKAAKQQEKVWHGLWWRRICDGCISL